MDFDGSEVHAGHIWVILPDDKIIAFRNAHLGEIKLSLRTTETAELGEYTRL